MISSTSVRGSTYAYRPRPIARDGKHIRKKVVRRNSKQQDGGQVNELEDINNNSEKLEFTDLKNENESDDDDDQELISLSPIDNHEPYENPDVQETHTQAYLATCQRLAIAPVDHFMKELHTTEVSLDYHQLGPAGARAIAIALVDNMTVITLNLTGCGIEEEGAGYILDMLTENRYLENLKIGQNNLGSECASKLKETLCENKMIIRLDVSNNNFKDSDGAYFAQILEKNEVIRELNLSLNAFGEITGEAFSDVFDKNTTLRILDLSWNHFRKNGAIRLIEGLKTNIGLTHVNLAWNGLSNEGCIAMSEVLGENSSITHLDLTANRVNLLGFRYLTNGIYQNSTLRVLKIGNNPITTAGAMEILNAVGLSEDCAIEELDLTNVSVGSEFNDLLSDIKQTRRLSVRHGTTLRHDSELMHIDVGKKDESNDPCLLLFKYLKSESMRLTDLFSFLDRKKRGYLAKEDFRVGLKKMGFSVSGGSVTLLMKQLDIDGDGQVGLDEFYKISRHYNRKVRLLEQQELEEKEKEKEMPKLFSAIGALKQKNVQLTKRRSSVDMSVPTSSQTLALPVLENRRRMSVHGFPSKSEATEQRSRRKTVTMPITDSLPIREETETSVLDLKVTRRRTGVSYAPTDSSNPHNFLPSIN